MEVEVPIEMSPMAKPDPASLSTAMGRLEAAERQAQFEVAKWQKVVDAAITRLNGAQDTLSYLEWILEGHKKTTLNVS